VVRKFICFFGLVFILFSEKSFLTIISFFFFVVSDYVSFLFVLFFLFLFFLLLI